MGLNMKTHVTLYDFEQAFKNMNRLENFSYPALRVLFEYFEQLEEDLGEEIELDVIAICCDYNELTFEEFVSQYNVGELVDIEAIEHHCQDHGSFVGMTDTTVIFGGF